MLACVFVCVVFVVLGWGDGRYDRAVARRRLERTRGRALATASAAAYREAAARDYAGACARADAGARSPRALPPGADL